MDESGADTHKKISRRDFLELTGVALGGYIAYRYDDVLTGLFGNEYDRFAEQAKSYLKTRYKLDVFVGLPENDNIITGTNLNKYELSRGLGLVMEEIIKYPLDFFEKNGVTAIRFLNDVKIGGKDYYGGFAGLEGTIGIAYAARPFELQREYFRAVFHHELFHILDYKDGGFDQDNQQWRDLHQCGCQLYREIGGRDNSEGAASSPIDWFLNDYGQRNPIEDRAEFGRFMMTPRLHQRLNQRINDERDPKTRSILEDKYRLTVESYKKWSGGLMDEKYWKDLINGEVQEGYFSSRPKGELKSRARNISEAEGRAPRLRSG